MLIYCKEKSLCLIFSDDTFIQAPESLWYSMETTCPQICLAQVVHVFLAKKQSTKQNPPGTWDYTKPVFLLLPEEQFTHPNVEHILNVCQLQLSNTTEHNSQINGCAQWFSLNIQCYFHIHCFKVLSCSIKVFQEANLGYILWKELRSNSTQPVAVAILNCKSDTGWHMMSKKKDIRNDEILLL